MQMIRKWFKQQPKLKPVPDPGTTRREPQVVVERQLAPGTAAAIERHGAVDPHVVTVEQLEHSLAELDRRIDILTAHRAATVPEGSNDWDNYQYQAQLNTLIRARVRQTRELARAGEPVEPRKPMNHALDNLYLRLYQTQDWFDNRNASSTPLSVTIQNRVHYLMHELIREIRDWSNRYEPATSVHVITQSQVEQQQNQQRLDLLLTDQWHDYIKSYRKKK